MPARRNRARLSRFSPSQARSRSSARGVDAADLEPMTDSALLGEGIRQLQTEAAKVAVERGLLQAEEKYLVDPDATLGTWFARVQEPISVAARVTLTHIEESRLPIDNAVAEEQLGLHADICAEAIRAAAQVWEQGPSPRAREEILDLVSRRRLPPSQVSWSALLISVARCSAALEPLANGLRERDLPMGEPTDCSQVVDSFVEAAGHAFGATYVLC